MLNLEKYAGLPIRLDDDFNLVFEDGLPPVTPQLREISAMRNYIKDASSTFWRKSVYDMYRGIAKPEDGATLKDAGIQYDITVLFPGKIGDEFAKTNGHYHSFQEGTRIRFPEIYEVIYGKVFFMIQSATPDLEKLQEACVITVEKGEKAVIPPGFGHVMINASDDVAVTANWQPTANASDYSSYEKHNGAAYYVIESERLSADGKRTTKEPEFVPNLNYKEIPKLIHARPRELPQYNLRSAWPMYASAVQDPAKLDFLPHPANYLEELTPEKLFTNQK